MPSTSGGVLRAGAAFGLRLLLGSGASLCFLGLGFAGLGCSAGPAPVTPRGATEAYARAIEQGKYGEAYELLSQDARADVSREEFERRLREHPEDTARFLK